MNDKVVVLLAATLVLWLAGYFIGLAPRASSVMFWLAGIGTLVGALICHVRSQ